MAMCHLCRLHRYPKNVGRNKGWQKQKHKSTQNEKNRRGPNPEKQKHQTNTKNGSHRVPTPFG